MKAKIMTGLALAAMMISVVIYGRWLFLLLIMAGAGVAMWEYYRLIQIKKAKPMFTVGIAFGMAFILAAYLSKPNSRFSNSSGNIGTVITLYVFTILVIQFWQIIQRRERYGMMDLAVTVFGSLYIGAFGSFVFLLSNMADAEFPKEAFRTRLVILLPMFAAWGSDVGAYFAGKFFGRNRIFPELSPKKTLEGCIGGAVFAMVLFCFTSFFVKIPFFHAIFLGFVASVFGQIGDLSESAFKRELGIKDSGTLFGSHGGVLDRIDSFLFTLPVVYYYFVWFRPWS